MSDNLSEESCDGIVIKAPAEHHRIRINRWRVREGFPVSASQVILLYEVLPAEGDVEHASHKIIHKFKTQRVGVVKKRLFNDGAIIKGGTPILELSECVHTTVIKDMCADCGADLRQNENGNTSEASVPMVHSIPDLKVTQKLAQKLGHDDTRRLLQDRKLVLLVDLDQTIIHTTNDNVPNNIKSIYHFQLYGPQSPWYHTRLRPGTLDFLNSVSKHYELHICTFGARNYAHMIAKILDPNGKYFSHRILSRDECFNPTSKTDNLKLRQQKKNNFFNPPYRALFPNGDSMVCIIDDREDVWNMASNLIQVKPYHFFQHTGDINAPPELSKHELDDLDTLQAANKEKCEQSLKNEKTDENIEESADPTSCSESVSEVVESTNDEEKSLETKNNVEGAEGKEFEENAIPTEEKDLIIDQKKEETEKVNEKSAETEEITAKIKLPADPAKEIEIEDPDDYLLYLEIILRAIHVRFYSIYNETKEIPDLKIIVPKIRSEVLRGCNLVFSGLVPTNMKLQQSRAYFIAKSLGANVSQNIGEDTTHLVAVTSGTFKVNAAKKNSQIKIVNASWLWCCAERWEHVDEPLFPLDRKMRSKQRQPPAHCHSPEHVVNYSEKSEISSSSAQQQNASEPEKFIDTINPLLSFSNADLADMNKEFDQFFDSDSSSEDEHVDIGEDLPSDLEIGSDSNDNSDDNNPDEEDDGEWNMMGAALEREFLGLED
uniref:RNA polymerase II subunit A C-terminal domain phosphatase n=1 Tax=Glossina pallidipes TaxID=7398 RepID=A0A1B0AAP6_GLOPL